MFLGARLVELGWRLPVSEVSASAPVHCRSANSVRPRSWLGPRLDLEVAGDVWSDEAPLLQFAEQRPARFLLQPRRLLPRGR